MCVCVGIIDSRKFLFITRWYIYLAIIIPKQSQLWVEIPLRFALNSGRRRHSSRQTELCVAHSYTRSAIDAAGWLLELDVCVYS